MDLTWMPLLQINVSQVVKAIISRGILQYLMNNTPLTYYGYKEDSELAWLPNYNFRNSYVVTQKELSVVSLYLILLKMLICGLGWIQSAILQNCVAVMDSSQA